MSKKPNYYQVHKNKKPKKQLQKGLHPKVIECIALATEIVNKAINIAKVNHHFRVISADEVNSNRPNAYRYLEL